MASISKQANGRRLIQFTGIDGRRKTIRLGKVSPEMAKTIKGRIESLLTAKESGCPLDSKTARWLDGIGTILASRLKKAGLIQDCVETELVPSDGSAAESGAVGEDAPYDDDLAEIIHLWPTRSEYVKRDVLLICQGG